MYHEKYLKQSPAPQVKCANWSQYASKAAWLSIAITKLDGRDFFWIDDDMSAQEIEAYQLPAHRCIQVSAHGSDALEHLAGQLTLASLAACSQAWLRASINPRSSW